MKIAHLSHNDGGSGAGRAAFSIHRGMRERGIESSLYVGDKRTNDMDVHRVGGALPLRIRQRFVEFREARYGRMLAADPHGFISPSRLGYFQPETCVAVSEADIVCLYWINGAFLSPEALSGLTQPMIWRLSDAWPFTGGCHYPSGCMNYRKSCGDCPQMMDPSATDPSFDLMRRKMHAWERLNLTIVAPSRWIAGQAAQSALFGGRRIETIPTGVDLDAFYPVPKDNARMALGLPLESQIVMFGGMTEEPDPRKGFMSLIKALKMLDLTNRPASPSLALFGADNADISWVEREAGLPVQSLGRLRRTEQLRSAYSAADLIVVPSAEDNLPNLALEAMACGAPIAAFPSGGIPELVIDGKTGRVARERTPEALAEIVGELLSDNRRLADMRLAARHLAKTNFSSNQQVGAFTDLCHDVLSQHQS